jgi:hypothetical protein
VRPDDLRGDAVQDIQPGDLVTALDEASLSRFHMRGGTLALTAGVAVLGFALTLVLPEPAGLSLDEIAAARIRGTGPAGWPRRPKGFLSPVPHDLSYPGCLSYPRLAVPA